MMTSEWAPECSIGMRASASARYFLTSDSLSCLHFETQSHRRLLRVVPVTRLCAREDPEATAAKHVTGIRSRVDMNQG